MIIKTNNGVEVSGRISKDPEIKQTAGGKEYMRFSIKAASRRNTDGSWDSTFTDVTVWDNVDRWDGMLAKGDSVLILARELKAREYNGKTYWSVDADGIWPDGMVTYRWLQTVIDMAQQPTGPVRDEDFSNVEDATPFDKPEPEPVQTSIEGGRLYPGEKLSDYAAPANRPAQQPSYTALDAPISDDDDLPF